jgi:formate C-acetyltransferase
MARDVDQEPTDARYRPTDRIAALRERALAQPPELFQDAPLRAYFYMEGWMAADGQALPLRCAAALANIVANMPARMFPGEILVGEHSNGGDLLNFGWIPPDFCARVAEGNLSADQKQNLIAWIEARPFAFQSLTSVAPVPPEIQCAQDHGVVAIWGTDLNHSIRAYEKVLRLGFEGLRAEVEAALADLPLAQPEAPHHRANLLGWLKLCDAAMTLGARHAALARELAAAADDPAQRCDWLAIAEVCDHVPARPARTFREALQSLWFAHMITVFEDGVNANSLGRVDQFLWPYLAADLAADRLSRDEAADLLAAFWIKLYQPYDVQQMTIGGLTPDGADATNPLSYLVLDVTEGLGFVRCLSARVHRGSPREFVSRCVDLISRGGGIPFFFNDEAIVLALLDKGIPAVDARDYAPIGCIEITIPGRANPHAVSNWINLAKCLELALNDGRDLLDDTQVGLRTGTLSDFRSLDDVLAAYTAQLTHFADLSVYGSNCAEIAHESQYRLPYLSLLTEDCVARGLDIIEGGACYNYHSSAAMGLPNVADSLAALKSAVFDDARLSPADMLDMLRTDFAGHEDVCLFLRNRLPKYGNDEPLPDAFAADLAAQYCDLLGSYRTVRGGSFHCHLFTFTLHLPYGRATGASPEGRRAGDPLAYSLSPTQGRDRAGFTAVINSLSRIPHHKAAASSSAILEAHPSLLEGAGREAFVDLLITAFASGVGQLQINVVSADTLRSAQEDPDRYRNLCVRVSGFSQQFVLLDREMQDHIIARTKHAR